ncbi:MAG: IS66 family insertion sequence element accessory protein TnpB [Bacteroidia bacterium]
MLSFSSKQRYFLYRGATDMRKSFNGLSGLVRTHFTHSLLSGDVFIFLNRRRDRIKLLMWDVSGFAIYYKRLEGGTFELPLCSSDQTSLELSWSELVMLLEGIELKSVKRRKRYKKSG